MRIPISRVRRETLYDISPNRPMAATNTATAPKSRYACARTFSWANRRSICDICVSTVTIGISGLMSLTACRIPAMTTSGSPAVLTLKTRPSGPRC